MDLEAIVALSLVLGHIAASRQVDLTVQVRGLRQQRDETRNKTKNFSTQENATEKKKNKLTSSAIESL